MNVYEGNWSENAHTFIYDTTHTTNAAAAAAAAAATLLLLLQLLLLLLLVVVLFNLIYLVIFLLLSLERPDTSPVSRLWLCCHYTIFKKKKNNKSLTKQNMRW